MLNTSETSITSIVVKKIVVNDNVQPNNYIIAFNIVSHCLSRQPLVIVSHGDPSMVAWPGMA